VRWQVAGGVGVSIGGVALVLLLGFLFPSNAQHRQTRDPRAAPRSLFVAPDGRKGADGSLAHPLRLEDALSAKSPARPGDTLWLRGGTYRGAFVSLVSGEVGAPITVRPYEDERAVIDSAPSKQSALTVLGAWTEFWDFEITNSDPIRRVTEPGSWPSQLRRSGGVDAHGPHNTFINLVIHDMADGMGIWADADGTSAYGNIIFYNGWEGPDRSHGHGIYTQNQDSVREIEDNIIYDQFSHGIHAYGSMVAHLDNITLRGNIVFDNGSIARSGGERDILLGGGRVAHNAVIEENMTYGPEQSNVGYVAGCLQATIARNYFSGVAPLILGFCQPEMTGNTFVGPVGPFAVDYPQNTYASTPPHGHATFVRPNRYDPSRANIAIYNWDDEPAVRVDLSSVLSDGAMYEVLDVQDYFGPPVLTGVYRAGERVEIPMTGRRVTPAVGNVSRPPQHTGPEFGAFVLRVPRSEWLGHR
jgi:hypothetical protein